MLTPAVRVAARTLLVGYIPNKLPEYIADKTNQYRNDDHPKNLGKDAFISSNFS
jgi:hypothetical protein